MRARTALLTAIFFCISAAFAADMQIYSPVPPAGYWMRMYPLRDYGAYWHLALDVHDVAKARAKALELLNKYKGESPIPLENMPTSTERTRYAQLSFRIDRKNGEKAWSKLLKLGSAKRRMQNENVVPEVRDEVPEKLRRLKADREAAGEAWAKIPALAGAYEEMARHLEAVQSAYINSGDRVLLNIVLEEKVP